MSRSALALLLFLCIYLHSTTVASPGAQGSNFYFLFGPNLFTADEEFNTQILVTTNESGPVNFWISWNKILTRPNTQSNTTHTVSRGEVEIIDIPHALSIDTRNPRTPDIGIQLQSQDGKKLTVVGVNEQQASTDAFLVFPTFETKSKTYEYFALSVDKGPFSNVKSFFGFVTTEPDTTITITPVTRIITFFGSFTGLDRGRNYTATVPAAGTSVASTALSDLSGTRIVSDKPLSFFTGHECGLIPSNRTACDHLVEQVPPTETWGFKFFLVPLSTRSGDGYRILASRGGTECSVTCTDPSLSESITLANPGDFKQLIYTTRYCSVECNRPVLIFQFSLGHGYDDVANSDPFAVMIPPVGQYSYDYDLVFFESKEVDTRGVTVVFEAWINIAIPAEYDPTGLRFDGSPLSGVRFVDVTCNDGEVCGRVGQYKPTFDTGSHKLEHIDPNARFTATVYGWERENTYGYVGGMNFDSIAAEIFCFKDRISSALELDGTASFVVTRSGSAIDHSCIGYTVGDVSTQGATDYSNTSGECCFEVSQKETTCTIQLVVDSVPEGDEVLRMELAPKPGQCVCEAPGNTTDITITEMVEPPVFVFERDRYDVSEIAGTVRIGVVKKSGDILGGQSVILNVTPRQGSGQRSGAGPATEGDDYNSTTQQVVFQSGDLIQYVEIPITDDGVCERTEYFYADLTISAGSGSVGAPNITTVFITEEVVEVQFNPKYYVVNESDGEVTLILDCGPCAHSYNVSLECSDGSAQDFLDYSVPSPLVTMCNPGSNKSFVDISITDNTLNEPTENFTCRITDVPEGVTPGPDDEATVDIIDDDRVLVVNFNPVEYSVVEKDGSVTLTVVASAPSLEPYSVFVDTSDGPDPSATGGDDYREGPHEVIFPPGITSATVTIGITRDSDCECDEVFVGRLRVPGGSDVSVGTNDTATITIEDDDECQLMFDPPTYKVNESAGSVEVCVEMEKNCIGAFVLPLNTTDGPNEDRRAVAVNDYEAGPYTISFAEGQTRACTDIPIVDDDVHEPEQDFTVSMEVPSGLPLRPGDNATVTITDDDPFRCMVGEGSIVVLESDGVIALNISIDREIEVPVTCEVVTQPRTAKDDTDFKPILEVVTFVPQGRRTQPVSLQIIDDDRSEPIEDLRIEIASAGLQEERSNEPAAAINVTIIDDDTRCLISEGGLLRTFLNESMYRFTNTCPFELISTCPQGSEGPIPFQIHIDIVNGSLNSAKVAIEYEASTVVITEDGRVTRIGSDIAVSERDGRIIARVKALDVTVTRTFGEAGQISVSVSNSSDLLSQLCGLCGNSEGVLSFKDQTVASPDNAEQFSRFLEEFRVPRTEQIFTELRSACVGEPQVRNDTVIGDPLYEVPLRLSSELMEEYGELSLCYEIHGRANAVFNLISDVCVSVNAHYTPMIVVSKGNVINQIGILAEDNNGQCQSIEVNLTGCAASVNGVGVTNYDQDGIHVIRRSQSIRFPRVRVSVPNCNNHEVVMWVVCEQRQGQPMIKFVVARGHNLSPTSHGLIAQFWNVDISAEKYTVTDSDRINSLDTHFAVTVRPPIGDARRFFADLHPKTWNKDNKYCLYAGNGQGGRVFEVPSLPDPVIEGRYFNYQMKGLFATRYQYSRFTADCEAEDTV